MYLIPSRPREEACNIDNETEGDRGQPVRLQVLGLSAPAIQSFLHVQELHVLAAPFHFAVFVAFCLHESAKAAAGASKKSASIVYIRLVAVSLAKQQVASRQSRLALMGRERRA